MALLASYSPVSRVARLVLYFVFQLLGALEDLLGGGDIVPEIRVTGFLLQLLHLPARALQIQGGSQLFQPGANGS